MNCAHRSVTMRLKNRFTAPILTGSATPHKRILTALREQELRSALLRFPPPAHEDGRQRTVLEIGAGIGQQAKTIEALGYRVVAIDLANSYYKPDRVHDVIDYDGQHIPLEDGAADIVFISNVLEHVRAIDDFLDETRRVLARDGIAIHILPSSSCRFWSIPAHYVWLVRRLYTRMQRSSRHEFVEHPACNMPRTPGSLREWLGLFFPLRHGERGFTLTEIYYYSRNWWRRTFRRHGFIVVRIDNNRLFYTMANSLADSLSLTARRRLARSLGSACHIYLLKADVD